MWHASDHLILLFNVQKTVINVWGKLLQLIWSMRWLFIFIFDFLIFVPVYYHWFLKYSYMHILVQALSKCPYRTLKFTVKNTCWGNMTLRSSFLAVWRKWKNLTIKSRALLSLSMNIPLYLVIWLRFRWATWHSIADQNQSGVCSV